MSIFRCSSFDRLARLWWTPRAVLPALFCALLGSVSVAHSQELTIDEQYDAAFLEMYEDVGNLDKTFRFAELAIAVGDLEGAVAAVGTLSFISIFGATASSHSYGKNGFSGSAETTLF